LKRLGVSEHDVTVIPARGQYVFVRAQGQPVDLAGMRSVELVDDPEVGE
jgi:hypothetical protein